MKLATFRCHYDLRKFSFGIRLINLWTTLPDKVISAESVDTFKSRLDEFWKGKMLYLITRLILEDLQAEVLVLMMLFYTFKEINKLSLKVICMQLTGTQIL